MELEFLFMAFNLTRILELLQTLLFLKNNWWIEELFHWSLFTQASSINRIPLYVYSILWTDYPLPGNLLVRTSIFIDPVKSIIDGIGDDEPGLDPPGCLDFSHNGDANYCTTSCPCVEGNGNAMVISICLGINL